MRNWTNGQLLRAVLVLAGAATLFGLIDVVLGTGARRDTAKLERRVQNLERELDALRKRPSERP